MSGLLFNWMLALVQLTLGFILFSGKVYFMKYDTLYTASIESISNKERITRTVSSSILVKIQTGILVLFFRVFNVSNSIFLG